MCIGCFRTGIMFQMSKTLAFPLLPLFTTEYKTFRNKVAFSDTNKF